MMPLSTAAGGFDFTSAAERRFAVAVGSLCEARTVVLVSHNGPHGDSVRAKLPSAPLVQGLGGTIRTLCGGGYVALQSALSSRALGDLATEDGLPIPDLHALARRVASAPRPRRFQRSLTKIVFRAHFDAFTEALNGSPGTGRPPRKHDSYEGVETRPRAGAPSETFWSQRIDLSTGTVF